CTGEAGGDQGRDDDHHSAPGGCPTLGEVRRRTVLPDELPVVAVHQEADEQRGAQQGDDQCGSAGEEDRFHRGPSPPDRSSPATMRSASCISPAPLEDFTSTTSPSVISVVSSPSASSRLAVTCTRDTPAARAAGAIGSAPRPTVTRTCTPVRAHSSPTTACSAALLGPSSSISPRTATVRRAPAIDPSACSAARIESGVAL